MALSHPFKEDRLAKRFQRLSLPGDRWCDVLGFVPAGSVSSFSTLQIFCLLGCFPSRLVVLVTGSAFHKNYDCAITIILLGSCLFLC